MRYVPQSLGNSSFFGAGFSGYPVKAILPDSFLMRRNNKGLENAAVSPTGKTAWTMMQVLLGHWDGLLDGGQRWCAGSLSCFALVCMKTRI